MLIEEEKVEIIEDKDKNKNNVNNQLIPENQIHNSNNILIIFSVFLSVLIAIFIILFIIFSFYNANKQTISQGVYINNINISGLSKEQALTKVQDYYNENILNKDIVLIHNDYETYIKPSEIELTFDISDSVDYAYNIGKTNGILKNNYDVLHALIKGINIDPLFTLNKDSLSKILEKTSSELPDKVIESSYYIDGNTLIITKGKTGNIVNVSETTNKIESNIQDLSFLSNKTDIAVLPKEPDKPNLEEIHKKIYKKAVNASFTKNPYTVYPSSVGLDFNISLEEAQKRLDKSKNECKIPLKKLYPKVTTNDIGMDAFPNLLATFSTNYSASNVNRTTNLKLAASKINGTVLLPGETFSYNTVVGARTIAGGYKEAPIYQNGETIDGLGGGICQISTTLFNCALLANLNIKELHNHQFVPSYVGAGRDATVVYGAKDFKFVNSRKYAIKITCSVSGGIARFNIYGVKEKPEYKVSISSRVTSRTASYTKSVTYRTLYSKGQKVKSEVVYYCTYKNH